MILTLQNDVMQISINNVNMDKQNMITLSMGLFLDKNFRKNIRGYRNENRTENVKAMAKP